MLLSPRQTSGGVDGGVAAVPQFQRPAAAADRPANGFLTLPEVSADVAVRGKVRFHTPEAVTALARAHFDTGALRARDVKAPTGVGDAYAQVGRGRIAVIYTPVWYCYRSSGIADTSGQIEVAQLGDI